MPKRAEAVGESSENAGYCGRPLPSDHRAVSWSLTFFRNRNTVTSKPGRPVLSRWCRRIWKMMDADFFFRGIGPDDFLSVHE